MSNVQHSEEFLTYDGNLPDGWASATLKQLVGKDGVFADGDWVESKDQDPNGDVRLIQLADVGDGWFRDQSARFMTQAKVEELDCTLLVPGDVMVARMPDPLGRACIFPGDERSCVTVVDVCVIRPGTTGPKPIWILHSLNSPNVRARIEGLKRGTTRQRVSRKNLGALIFPVPPLAEQERIVAKVESLLERVNKARERLARVPDILKRFRQSVLAAACSGRLTADWREENSDCRSGSDLLCSLHEFHWNQWQKVQRPKKYRPAVRPMTDVEVELPETWTVASPEELCESIVDCPHSTPKWIEQGEVCFRTTNFKPGVLDLSEVRYVSSATYDERIARLEPKPSDVVYSREGGILGIACMIPKGTRACLGQRMMLFRTHPDACLPTHLMLTLNSPFILGIVREKTGGTSSPHLNVGDIRKFPIPLPPLEEQQEIIERVNALFALADRIGQRLSTGAKRAEQITQSVLAKAFTGELVETEGDLARREGRDYEPASVLLERITAKRIAAATNSKPKRMRKSKTVSPTSTRKVVR